MNKDDVKECSSINLLRELGSERWKSVWSISLTYEYVTTWLLCMFCTQGLTSTVISF